MLTVIETVISLSLNSRMMVNGPLPTIFWINFFPSNVIIHLNSGIPNFFIDCIIVGKRNDSLFCTQLNSLSSSNVISEILDVDDVVISLYLPSESFFNSTVGNLRVETPTNPFPNSFIRQLSKSIDS